MIWVTLSIWAVVVLVLIFWGSAYLMAKVDVGSAPREEMMWCHKHGHFRKGHAIPMVGTLVCPQCYAQALAGPDGKLTLRR